jgi:hypothetical protein
MGYILFGRPLTFWTGLLTIILVFITLFSGLKIIKASLKGHRRMGLIAGASALIHATLVILAYL